jgi:benzoyl-CoA 2,3-dioxygenase component B
MKEHDTDDIRPYGGIDLATLQRYINFHYTVSLDLFGSERSTNAANYFSSGLKGRYEEDQRDDDHRLGSGVRAVPVVEDGRVVDVEVPLLSAVNHVLQSDYVDDCQRGIDRWNKALAAVGAELHLPHVGFHRAVGSFAGHHISPTGQVLSAPEWDSHRDEWLPSDDDRAFVDSLMVQVTEPGKMAGWIAPPTAGINRQPVDYQYVRLS